jgi:hypothetical protein
MARKRQIAKPRRQVTSKQKSRRAASPRKPSRKQPDLQERLFRVFAEQAGPLWTDLTNQCQQFADGFNQAIGAAELQVQAAPTTLRVAYPRADAELFVQLDTVERYVQATLNTGCGPYGNCADQPAVGLTVNDNALRFVLAGEVVSNEQLAVALLTQLTSGKSEQAS